MYRFLVCELKSGRVLDEAPFTIEGGLSRQLQGYGSGRLNLPVREDSCPANWEQLVLPWRSLVLVLDEGDRIVSHGIPTNRLRAGGGVVGFPCVTVEGYLLRRHVPSRAYRNRDQALIAQDLAAVCADSVGLPLVFDTPLTGVFRDRDYADDENATVYDRLQQLAAVQGGFNWAMDVEWTDDSHQQVRYVFRTGYPFLGNRSPNPEHVFDLPGNITGYEFDERWGDGDAATHVRGFGEGDGDTKPMSEPVVDTVREAAGWPRLEERRNFSGVSVQSTLDGHTRAAAAQLFGGQQVITLTARDGSGTSLGDLSLGDTARVEIRDDELTLDEVMVVVGWSLTPGSGEFKPTLARLE